MSYTEKDFETHIEEHLLNSGYQKNASKEFDKDLILIPERVLEFVKNSQPKEFQKLELQYGSQTEEKFCQRLSKELERKGVLEVLRKGISDRGAKFKLAYFKPANQMNPEHRELYEKNIFSVVRQLQYSKKNANELDLTIFLNGIPILTAELKNSLTGQFVTEAVKQYKKDRDPKEPLFKFKRCLVHFAVGNEKVFMTTRLSGGSTRFLPFNKDTENPVNPNGHKTAYLWEDIWQQETLLDLIQNYLHVQKNSEKYFDKNKGFVTKESEVVIFPRFHQLDVVRNILKALKTEGTGKNYLVQHSAGSGKSNSIAWLSHQLASFYQNEADRERLFDSVIVVTDRKVLDRQLQNTIKQFEQVEGVVKKIEVNSEQLRNALETGKDIIVTTLQKFPIVAKNITKLEGRNFAVVIDEAHSSQSGESSKKLKEVLSTNLEEAEKEESQEFDLEDEIVKEARVRGRHNHISYFSFTATPKNKTLELFGRKTANGDFRAFHIYSMRQAIEEGFILDVLNNYTTFKRYFKLVKSIDADNEYEKKKALRLLTSYVDLQPHAIKMKTQIMLDHFLETTTNAIQGKGRAMLVTRSRLHAVKYFLSFQSEMKARNLQIKPLVAFSGTVKDPDTQAEHTENSLNALQSKVSIPDALKMPEFRILIVANKFQTGFDEPLLHTMYVDKKLGGVTAVQTLSRLNRMRKAKTETVVLDFVNEVQEIQDSFQDFYQKTILVEETEPNKLYDLQTELDNFEVYTNEDIQEFCEIFFNPSENEEKYQPILDRVVENWRRKTEDEREDFRSILQSFIRLYAFISQLITFQEPDWEKLYVFGKNLNRKLDKRTGSLPTEVLDAVDLDSFRIQETFKGKGNLKNEDGELPGIPSNGKSGGSDEEKELLSQIIQNLNETFGVDFSDEDKLDLENIKKKYHKNEELRLVLEGDNSETSKKRKSDKVLEDLFLQFVANKTEFFKKVTKSKVNSFLKQSFYEELKDSVRAGIN